MNGFIGTDNVEMIEELEAERNRVVDTTRTARCEAGGRDALRA